LLGEAPIQKDAAARNVERRQWVNSTTGLRFCLMQLVLQP